MSNGIWGQRKNCPFWRFVRFRDGVAGNGDVAPPVRLNPARKLSKPISRNHCPTRLTRPTRPTCHLPSAKPKGFWEGQRPRCPIRRRTGNEDVAPPGLVFLSAMFASFLCCFNSPAAPAADEIRIQKKRAEFDAQIAKML